MADVETWMEESSFLIAMTTLRPFTRTFGPQLMQEPLKALTGPSSPRAIFKSSLIAKSKAETYRVLRQGGLTGFTCWTKAG